MMICTVALPRKAGLCFPLTVKRLCSPEAEFVTGFVLPVDGGASIGF